MYLVDIWIKVHQGMWIRRLIEAFYILTKKQDEETKIEIISMFTNKKHMG